MVSIKNIHVYLVSSIAFFITVCSLTVPLYAEENISPEKIVQIAEPAFREWLAGIPEQQFADFGFLNHHEIDKASLAAPIPHFFPSAQLNTLTQSAIEEEMSDTPVKWTVPVTVAGRVACLVIVNQGKGQELQAAEFGKAFAANRLDAGLRLLGWPEKTQPAELRLISFYGPVYELLLIKGPEGWTWINLTGTQTGEARIQSTSEIQDMLDKVKNAKSMPAVLE